MSNLLRGVVVAGVLALALSGCGTSDTADSGKPKVLTTFTVVADMVRQVGGDRIEVASITKPGAEIHGYEPTPSDLKHAATSDLVLQNGMGLERWFEQFVDLADAKHVTLTTGVKPIPIAGESEYAGKPNPHAWMSVSNAKIYVENIRKALTDLDPAGAAVFAANAREYSGALDEVGATVKRELAALPPQRRALVTCEGAFSYMARDFGLTERYLWPVNAEQEGTPQQIASTVTFVRGSQVPAIFCESTVSDKAQKQVANESGARFGGVLYVDSLSEAGGPVPTYLDLLRRDADTIIAGLTGAST
ncbi:metal ABC transporter substrate-binding protein [Solirubrobacter phytolaccae]|uniref:Metal ABC transporter substrate-binding protein n=1 Tax=Solirubrobacter phytolaccae TaxID=1404360 RepID=A0A9X3S811_9ACTN|nr:metal ABC transporter substrate-binding protein [Solirubrobacter phytolaccae]MDA0181654.1 metal ABC transporter substrate-binding protein [Solirubrobacter phytolaccae]